MKKIKTPFIIVAMILMSSLLLFSLYKRGEMVHPFATEIFIEKWLKNNNSTLATYVHETESEDEDLVKGREALSETLGLWMEYALLQEDKKLFDESYHILNNYFLTRSGFVHWKLTEFGKSEVSSNALVDDLRIVLVLIQAAEKWSDTKYKQTAKQISKYTAKNNNYKGVLTDFYERKDKYANDVVTLTYMEPDALHKMKELQLIEEKTINNMDRIFTNMPVKDVFFPKAYNVKNKIYIFEEQVNLIDQSLVALYRAKRGQSTTLFTSFIREELNTHGVIYGKYDLHTSLPIVTYESPAIYGWLIMYCLELDENKLAKELFSKMKKHQNRGSKYYGGYSVYDDNTHIFDNLVPLLAEVKLYNEGVIK